MPQKAETARNRQVARLVLAGHAIREVARMFEVSPLRVRQILWRELAVETGSLNKRQRDKLYALLDANLDKGTRHWRKRTITDKELLVHCAP